MITPLAANSAHPCALPAHAHEPQGPERKLATKTGRASARPGARSGAVSAGHRLRRPSMTKRKRSAASPPPCGEGQGGGIAEHRRWGFTPPLTPPPRRVEDTP